MERVSDSDVEVTEAVDGVRLAQLAAGERMSVQRFVVDPDATVPEHSHPSERTGYLVSGALVFEVDGEGTVVEAGDSYAVPADEPHRAENRGDVPAEGIDTFSPPRPNPSWEG